MHACAQLLMLEHESHIHITARLQQRCRCLVGRAEDVGLSGEEEADDESKQAQNGTENLDDKNLDEARWFVLVLGGS